MNRAMRLALAASLLLTGCAASKGARRAEAAAAPPPAAADPTPRPFSLPEAKLSKLRNGIAITTVTRSHLPLATVRVVVKAGEIYDENAKAGLASLTGQLLKRGAGSRTAPQLAEAIDATGGSLSVSVGPDATTITLTVLKRDLARGLGLLADVLTRPRLDGVELSRLITEHRAELEAALDDGDEVADFAAYRVALMGHPYGRPPSRAALSRIRREDVRRFYTRWYRPERTTAVVVGDVGAAEAQQLLDKALGNWRQPGKPTVEPKRPAPPKPPTRPTVWLVDMNVNQSYIRLVTPSAPRANPDRVPLRVMNFVLGGDFTSRLNLDIRDKEGLAYGASSRFEAWKEAGMFSARVNTRTETTRRAIDRLLVNLHSMRDDLISDEELSGSRDHLVGAFPMRFETNADVARELADSTLYDLPADDAVRFRDRAAAVTAAEVRDVARRHVPSDTYHLVVVGQASRIAGSLTGLGDLKRINRASLVH